MVVQSVASFSSATCNSVMLLEVLGGRYDADDFHLICDVCKKLSNYYLCTG